MHKLKWLIFYLRWDRNQTRKSLTWVSAVPHGAGVKACSAFLIIRITNNLMPTSTVLFTCSRTEWRCKICSFIHNDCGRLPAEKGRSLKNLCLRGTRETASSVANCFCRVLSLAYLPYRSFSCSLLPVNMQRSGNWKKPSSVTISLMHVMVFNTRTQLLLEIS